LSRLLIHSNFDRTHFSNFECYTTAKADFVVMG